LYTAYLIAETVMTLIVLESHSAIANLQYFVSVARRAVPLHLQSFLSSLPCRAFIWLIILQNIDWQNGLHLLLVMLVLCTFLTFAYFF